MRLLKLLLVPGILFTLAPGMQPQAPPTNNILTRILMLESQYGRGSTFSLDVDQREYWITAKHILTGARHPPYGSLTTKSMSLRVLNPGAEGEQWLTVNFSVIDPGRDIDIAVLAAPQPLLSDPLPSVAVSSSGVLLGGDCEFLGFPYGGAWRATYAGRKSYWMPFVKHCTISGFNVGEPEFMVLDGINNEGFSGGPVLYQTGPNQQVIAVISGYQAEIAEVISSLAKEPVVKNPYRKIGTVGVNSGFILAFGIDSAMDAIHKNPIGPLRAKPGP